jgi:rRNA maturation RNase YbeY
MLLVAHGVLHLLGYDHEESEEAAVMKSLQDRVINLA